MPARKSQYQVWYEIVKRELLVTEPQNILARAECCQNIINECLSHMNMSLGLPIPTPAQQYHCQVNTRDHLTFLLNWPGLRVDNSPKAPKTKKEYEKKSKNWLNGRRAPNYGKTLFPFFISDAEKYLLHISKLFIEDDTDKQKLYYDIVIYKVLAQLCGCSVSLHEQAKKAPFFCKNSVERKGRLKELLQSYAPDHEYIQGFPSCFEEAIGYFDRKSNMYFHRYRKQYLGYNNSADEDDLDSINSEYSHSVSKGKKSKSKSKSYSFRTGFGHRMHPKKEKNQIRMRGNGNGSTDAEYWKKQFLNLKRELNSERRIRMNAERERDNLKNLINTSTDNMNVNMNGCAMSVPQMQMPYVSNNLQLKNDGSYQSMHSMDTTSTTSSGVCNGNTLNMCGMPALQPSNMNSFSSQSTNQSIPHMSNGCQQSFTPVHTPVNFNNFYANDMSTMNTMNAMNASFVIPHNVNQPMRPPLPPQPMMFQPSLNEIPSADAFSSIIDTMPMMRPQMSNESFGDNSASLYSFQNTAVL